MGLDAVGKTRYRRCARLRHLSVAARATNANSRKSFSWFPSRGCHGDRGRARRRIRCTRHHCVARRHRRHCDVHAPALRDGFACGRPRGVGSARRTLTRVDSAAPEFAHASLCSRAFAGRVCADLHIRVTRDGIGPTNHADHTGSTRAPSMFRPVSKRCRFWYVYNVTRRPRCRAARGRVPTDASCARRASSLHERATRIPRASALCASTKRASRDERCLTLRGK
jgi:hypothetical protein